MQKTDWQPARIADHAHVSKYHVFDPRATSCWAGETVRVRKSQEAFNSLEAEYRNCLGCHAQFMVELHPEDAKRLWPDIDDAAVGLCEHQILTD